MTLQAGRGAAVHLITKLRAARIITPVNSSGQAVKLPGVPIKTCPGGIDGYLTENGYESDFSDTRLHHEIYLTDARRVAPEKWKTVIRHPIRKA